MATIDGWMPLAEFCVKYGQRPNTLHKRVFDGIWERGVMFSSPTAGTSYVHEPRAVAWLIVKGYLKPDTAPEELTKK